jgi:alpha-glucosidase (family GH31 glycosyl hydrolase)
MKIISILLIVGTVGLRTALAQGGGCEVLGSARFTVVTPQLIRMEYSPDRQFVDAPSWFAVNRSARFTGYEVQRRGDSLTIDTGAIKLVYRDDVKPFHAGNLRADIKKDNATVVWQPGMASADNLGGADRTLDGWRQAAHLPDGVLSRDGWYLLDDSRSVLAVGGWFEERPKNDAIDWYLFGYGLDFKSALKSLTTISGPVPLPRKSTFGVWYSRYWPYSSDDFKQIVAEYHEHGFPLDNIVMDMDWHTDGWTGYTWNSKLIPDGLALLRWFHEQGLAVTLNDHPADGVQPKESMYAEFMTAMGADPATKQTIPFDAGSKKYLDTFYQYTHEPLVKAGVDFWWLDWQQYPATRSIPDLSNLALLNDYYFKKTGGDGRRGQSMSRWAGWGDQRHPIHFSGDADTGWKMLTAEVPFTSASSNSGCFFWTHDIGGHMGGRNEESYARWCQFGALSAALRSHSTRNATMDRRPWTYPDWAEKSMRISFRLRAELMPYIYSAAREATQSSVPFVRATYIDYPRLEDAYHNGQEYLLGDDALVAPITMPGVGPNRVGWQHVWFPDGTWYQYFTGEKYQGGTNEIAAADIDEFPLFIRGGVPLAEQPYADRPTTAPLTHLILRCYPGEDGRTGTSTLYEDDGISADYLRGGLATTELSYERHGSAITLKIAGVRGSYNGQPMQRGYTILLPNTAKATLVGPADAQISYDEATETNKIEIPATDIRTPIEVNVVAEPGDIHQLHDVATARRLQGVLGEPLGDWSKADKAGASPETLAAVNAVRGIGLVAANQHPYLLGHDTKLYYFNADSDQALAGAFSYGSWSKHTALIPGQAVDISGLAAAIPPADIVEIPGQTKWINFLPDNGNPPLAVEVSSVLEGTDLALNATASANAGDPSGINDGVADGYPRSQRWEWVPGHDSPKPDWIKLDFGGETKVKRVDLYDRPNLDDQVLGGTLIFSDGSTIDVGPLPNDGETPLEVSFSEKTISWIKFVVTKSSPTTKNIGLSEIAVYNH